MNIPCLQAQRAIRCSIYVNEEVASLLQAPIGVKRALLGYDPPPLGKVIRNIISKIKMPPGYPNPKGLIVAKYKPRPVPTEEVVDEELVMTAMSDAQHAKITSKESLKEANKHRDQKKKEMLSRGLGRRTRAPPSDYVVPQRM